MSYTAITSQVWLTLPSKGGFIYIDPDTKLSIITDASAYRPDPRETLKVNKKYTAQLVLEEVLIDKAYERVIRTVVVNGKTYMKIR